MLLPPSRRAWYRTRLGPANVFASNRARDDRTTAVRPRTCLFWTRPVSGRSAEREVRQPVGQVDGRRLRRLVVLAGQVAEALVLAPSRPDGERGMALLGHEGPANRGRSLGERERAERRRLAGRRHLHPVDPHRLARPRARAAAPARRPTTAIPLRRLPSHGTGLGGPHRAGEHRCVRVEPLPVRRLGRARPLAGSTRPPGGVARRPGSGAREPAWPWRAPAPPDMQTGCRRSGRGSCRPPPGRRAFGHRPGSLSEHRVLELRRVGEVAVARQAVQGGDVASRGAGSNRAGTASRPAELSPTSSDGSKAFPASAGASQSEWSRVQSHAQAAVRLVGVVAGRVERRPAPRPDARQLQLAPPPAAAASASHLTTSSHFESGCSPSRPPALGVELNVSIIPSRFVGTPIWIRSSMRVRIVPRSRRLPATAPCFEIEGPEK